MVKLTVIRKQSLHVAASGTSGRDGVTDPAPTKASSYRITGRPELSIRRPA